MEWRVPERRGAKECLILFGQCERKRKGKYLVYEGKPKERSGAEMSL